MQRSHFSVKFDESGIFDKVYSKIRKVFESTEFNVTKKGDNLLIVLSLSGSNFWVIQKYSEENVLEFDIWHNRSRPLILRKIMAMVDEEKKSENESKNGPERESEKEMR